MEPEIDSGCDITSVKSMPMYMLQLVSVQLAHELGICTHTNTHTHTIHMLYALCLPHVEGVVPTPTHTIHMLYALYLPYVEGVVQAKN